MFADTIDTDEDISKYLKIVCQSIKMIATEKNDDFFLLIVGDRATGKSMLGLHVLEHIFPEVSVRNIAFNKEMYPNVLNTIKNDKPPKIVLFDEGFVSKRDAMTGFNKDLLKTLYNIRGKNIINVWCNPSLQIIETRLIEDDIISALILTVSKSKNIRTFLYFTQHDLKRFYDKYQKFDLHLLRRVAGEYAYFQGYFRDYKGKLRNPYEEKKEERMNSTIEDFKAKHGEEQELFQNKDLAKMFGITNSYVQRFKAQLMIEGKLIEGVNCFNLHKVPKYTKEGVEHFKRLRGK